MCTALLFAVVISTLLPLSTVHAQQQPTVSLDPSTITATQLNQVFTLNISVANIQNLWGWSVNVTWDSRFVSLQGKKEGNFLSGQMLTAFLPTGVFNFTDPYRNSNTYQGIQLSCSGMSSTDGVMQDSVSGSGVLATLTFQVVSQTQSTPITLTVENLLGPVKVPTEGHDTTGTNPSITLVSISSTTSVSLIIPGPPTANAGTDLTVPAGTQAVFNASQSVSSGNNTAYAWTFVDGIPQNLTGMITNYTFNNPGNYTVTLTVTDSLGSSNCTKLVHVIGSLAAPTPTVTPTPDQNSTPTPNTSTTTDPTSTSTQNGGTQTNGSFNLPPTILGILVVITIFVFAGSFFWLRKRT